MNNAEKIKYIIETQINRLYTKVQNTPDNRILDTRELQTLEICLKLIKDNLNELDKKEIKNLDKLSTDKLKRLLNETDRE
jgi:hypothetical protein